jgi:hypothetical protein
MPNSMPGALGPAQRQLHRALDIGALRRQPHAFIHLHGDVGAEQALHLDRALRRQLDFCAIDMRAEGHGPLADLAQIRQRHHLEAAGIRQHRPAPGGESLQAAERGDPFGARPQHQMIGIPQHDVGAGFAHLAPVHALDGARGAAGHEGGRAHHAMGRGQASRARPAVGREQLEMVGKAHGGAYGVTAMPDSTGLGPIYPVDGGKSLPHKSAP